jgi:hypothetical protein
VIKETLNVVISGQKFSGLGHLGSALNRHKDISCYGSVLSCDIGELENPPIDFTNLSASPEQFLNSLVFNRPKLDEKCVAVVIDYSDSEKWELFDYFKEQSVKGDFCLIHLLRSPLETYFMERGLKTYADICYLDAEDLNKYVRRFAALSLKTNSAFEDFAVVNVTDLQESPSGVVDQLFKYLGLPGIDTCLGHIFPPICYEDSLTQAVLKKAARDVLPWILDPMAELRRG